MTKILVTGAGYVGTTTIDLLLSKGYQVRVLENFWKPNRDSIINFCKSPEFEFQCGSVCIVDDLKRAIDGVDAVIHLAALVGAPICARYPHMSQLVNVEGTKLILEEARHIPVVFASTDSVLGKLDEVCTEESPCNPLSYYGQHKLEAEKAVRNNHPKGVALRLATVGGVFNFPVRISVLINNLVYQAITNKSLDIFEGHARRTFIDVYDVARALEWTLSRSLNNTLQYNLYNVGDDRNNWTKSELAECIQEKTGCRVHYSDNFKDVDARDYFVDHSRLNSEGFYCQKTVPDIIDDLLKVMPIVRINHRYE